MEGGDFVNTGEAAKRLGVSMDTLRRWDASGYLQPTVRTVGGHRRYSLVQLDSFVSDLVKTGFAWARSADPISPQYYCERSHVFQARLDSFGQLLFASPQSAMLAPLIVSVCGEIGNNSFDHNIGNWPDQPGVYFAYDLTKRLVVLADRGRGILATLRPVKPSLRTDEEALRVAFTEILSGRAPESRGNGLKYVRKVVSDYPIHVSFQSGSAKIEIESGEREVVVVDAPEPVRGCFAIIRY